MAGELARINRQGSIISRELLNPQKAPPPVRSFELVRAKYDKVLEINALKQTFYADAFFEFKIRGGGLDEDQMREGEGPPTTYFPKDTLRPSARWYLNQFDFSNSVTHTVHHDTVAQLRGEDIHLRYRAFGEFAEQLELEDFPFDTQELTVKLIVHCVIGGVVSVEVVGPDYVDEFSGVNGVRAIPRDVFKRDREKAVLKFAKEPVQIKADFFKVDSFHLHNVWDLCNRVYGQVEVHAGEFPQLAMTCLVRRRADFYLSNVAVTMLVLEVMAFSGFAIEGATTEGIVGRISLAITLVLTCGIYRQTNAQFSPPVACLTLLDEYMLVSSLIIAGTVIVHAILALEVYWYETNAWEPYMIGLMLFFVIWQHVYAIWWRVLPAIKEAQSLGFKDSGLKLPGGRKEAVPHHHYSHMGAQAVRVFSSEKGRYTYVELDEQSQMQQDDGGEKMAA